MSTQVLSQGFIRIATAATVPMFRLLPCAFPAALADAEASTFQLLDWRPANTSEFRDFVILDSDVVSVTNIDRFIGTTNIDRFGELRAKPAHGHKPASVIFGDYQDFQIANWDGEGAIPVSQRALDIASKLIDDVLSDESAPDAAPGNDGIIGLEWWHGASRLFIDVGPNDEIRTYLNLGQGKPEEKLWRWGQPELTGYLRGLFAVLYQRSPVAGASSTTVYSEAGHSKVANVFTRAMSGYERSPTLNMLSPAA